MTKRPIMRETMAARRKPDAAPKPSPPQQRRIKLRPLSLEGRQWLDHAKAELGAVRHLLDDSFRTLERLLRIEETLQHQLDREVLRVDEKGRVIANPVLTQLRTVLGMKRLILRDLSLADTTITGHRSSAAGGAGFRGNGGGNGVRPRFDKGFRELLGH